MTNLLKETLVEIQETGKTPEDIVFIGSIDSGHACTWEEFKVLADFEYDSGYGSAKVASDLMIVFNDGTYMHRGEYDGSEWWEYVKKIEIPIKTKKITSLGNTKCNWPDLEKLNP